MSYSITTLLADLAGELHGTTLNKVTNLNGVINRAARQFMLDIDAQETKRQVLTSTPIYNQVWDYACPVDLKGNRVIDIYPQVLRTAQDVLVQTYNQPFDISKNIAYTQSDFTINFNNAVKTIRINDNSIPVGTTLDTADAVGNWTVGGTASSLTLDNVNFVSGSGSLKFNLAAGANPSTGFLSETLTTPINLSNQLNQSSIFFYLYFPTGADILSVSMAWGSDSSDYYTRTLAVTNENTTIATGWNLFRADWLGATVVGSPNPASIAYLKVGVNYNGNAQTGVNMDNIVSNLGQYRQINYYSKYLFRDAITGAFQETVTDNSNLVNLDTESYNLLLYLVTWFVVQQVQGVDGLFFDAPFFQNQYETAKTKYTSMYKSEVQKPQEIYYQMNKPGYSKYLGRRWF